MADAAVPARREPPKFRRVFLTRTEELTPHMRRIVLGGAELSGLAIDGPAGSVRLLLPPPREDALVMPTWTGNQFELPSGARAPIRTFTPRHFDDRRLELAIDVVLHDVGAATDWARSAGPGSEAAVSGPGRSYQVDSNADDYLLAGDETAIPAISQLLEAIPRTTRIRVEIEIGDPAARLELPGHPGATVNWHERSSEAQFGSTYGAVIEALPVIPAAVWIAGEAAAVQRIRKHLFDVRGVERSAATIRGYWKSGRSAT